MAALLPENWSYQLTGANDMIYLNSRNPDIATCSALRSGRGDLVFCLNEERALCDYCLPFGESYFCRHPQCSGAGESLAAGETWLPGAA